jgi:hypothetical protein
VGATAHMAPRNRINLGVVHPLLFAGACVQSIYTMLLSIGW